MPTDIQIAQAANPRHIDEIAAELKVPVLGKMPIDVKLAELADSGLFSKIENEYITAAADVMPKAEA